jgi:hypothetical protein
MSATAEETQAQVPGTESPKPTQLPLFEGIRVNEHRLNFAGNVLLTDPEVIKQMHLKDGDDVALVIRCRVVSRSHKKKEDKEGNVTGGISSTAIYVESVSAYEE